MLTVDNTGQVFEQILSFLLESGVDTSKGDMKVINSMIAGMRHRHERELSGNRMIQYAKKGKATLLASLIPERVSPDYQQTKVNELP